MDRGEEGGEWGKAVAVLRTRCVNRRQVALWRIKKICTSVTLAGHSSETQAVTGGGARRSGVGWLAGWLAWVVGYLESVVE